MTNRIYSLDQNNELHRLTKAEFTSEDSFQRLLADHPIILDVIAGDYPPLLIGREQGVGDGESTAVRWSLDHLYVDRGGVPILVEVKRAKDTRTRREVVAQMLDCAANGVAYWPLDAIIGAFEANCAARSLQPDQVLADFIPVGQAPEQFWRSVEANLRAGRIRMVFVADAIPKELRRIVEFLNEQMRPAEVLAVQVEQYTSVDGAQTLVPQLIGVTERATAAKAVSDGLPRISVDEWLAALADHCGPAARAGAERMIALSRSLGAAVSVARTLDSISFSVATEDHKRAWPFSIRSNGRLETSLYSLQFRPVFASDEARKKLLDELLAMPGLNASSTGKLTGLPSFPVEGLLRPAEWEEFCRFASHVYAEVRRSS